MKTTIVLNDVQIESYSRCIHLVTSFTKWLKPNGIVLNGDIVDLYRLSRFTKNPDPSLAGLGRELEICRGILLSQIPQETNTRIWIGGNHEDRYRRYIWDKAPELNIEPLRFSELAGCREYGFKWLEYGDGVNLGKLYVTHGEVVRKHSGYTAKAHYDKYGISVLHGHTHRLGQYSHRNRSGQFGAWENGCLCTLTPEFDHYPDWQHGFSVVMHDPKTGVFNVDQIRIFEESWMLYGGRKFYLTNRDKMRVQ